MMIWRAAGGRVLLCVVLLLSSSAAAPPPTMQVDVYVRAQPELGCEKFRMPSLVLSGPHTWLVFVACETKHGPTSIVVKASEDRGHSWGPARIAAGMNGSTYDGTNRYCPVGYADPASVALDV